MSQYAGVARVAETLEAASNWAGAEAAWRAELALVQARVGRHPNSANLLQALASNLYQQDRYLEAESHAREAVAIMNEAGELVGPKATAIRLSSLMILGHCLRALARFEEAERQFLSAARVAEARGEYEAQSAALCGLGVVYKYSRRFEEAEGAYLRSLEILERKGTSESAALATLFHNLGGLEHARGQFARGEPWGRKAWELRARILGADHWETMADACAYGGLLDGLGRTKESRPIYECALEIFTRTFGPKHFEVAATLHNLGCVEKAEGNPERAVECFRRALEIKVAIFGLQHPEVELTARQLDRVHDLHSAR